MSQHLQQLKINFNLYSYLLACPGLDWEEDEKRGWINFENEECPSCKKQNQGGINTKSKVFHCRACKSSYQLPEWIREREHFKTFKEVLKQLEKFQIGKKIKRKNIQEKRAEKLLKKISGNKQ